MIVQIHPNTKLQITFSILADQNLADSVKMLKNAYKWLSAPTSGSQRLQVALSAYKWLSAPTSGSQRLQVALQTAYKWMYTVHK